MGPSTLALAEGPSHTVARVASVLQASTEAVRQWGVRFLSQGAQSLARFAGFRLAKSAAAEALHLFSFAPIFGKWRGTT